MIRFLRITSYWTLSIWPWTCTVVLDNVRKPQALYNRGLIPLASPSQDILSLSTSAILYLTSVVAAPRRRNGLSVTKSFKSHQSQMSAKQLSLSDLEALGKIANRRISPSRRLYLSDMNQASVLAIISIQNKVRSTRGDRKSGCTV